MNRAYKFRIYPTKEQEQLLAKTFGCCRFVYNIMLEEKIREYRTTGKMKRTTPAMYKETYPWLKEVDSLALANVQLHLEGAYKAFFGNPRIGFPRFKSRHGSRQSSTTNVVNGNVGLYGKCLKLPKLKEIKIRKHREIPEGYRLKSVTVSKESTGKYYASLLYETAACESQAAAEKKKPENILGIDYAMDGMAVFSDGRKCGYPPLYRMSAEKLAREQRRLSHCQRVAETTKSRKEEWHCVMKR